LETRGGPNMAGVRAAAALVGMTLWSWSNQKREIKPNLHNSFTI